MIAKIEPGILSGNIWAPASKSSMQRACAAALVAGTKVAINNPGHSNDDKAALSVIESLGAAVQKADNTLIVDSSKVDLSQPGNEATVEVSFGESGLGIRMFTPILALSTKPVTINGHGSLVTRPMDFFDEILPQLRVTIQSNNGKLPLQLGGPLVPQDITIDGSLSSQFLTGLLMAYAAAGATNKTITVTNLKSRPYVDLTLDVMQQFGLHTPVNENYERFVFGTPVKNEQPINYTVEGDWSGGAFLLVAGAINGNITVEGLDPKSTQADKKILEALNDSGANIQIDGTVMTLQPAALKAFEFDATDCPDLFPPLVALASYAEGVTVVKGVSRLAHKESDRGITLQDEFKKMGIRIDLEGDFMSIHGGTGVQSATVHSRHDHRIAMACAVAALKASGPVTIEVAEAVNKSYPDFYDHIKQLGSNVTY